MCFVKLLADSEGEIKALISLALSHWLRVASDPWLSGFRRSSRPMGPERQKNEKVLASGYATCQKLWRLVLCQIQWVRNIGLSHDKGWEPEVRIIAKVLPFHFAWKRNFFLSSFSFCWNFCFFLELDLGLSLPFWTAREVFGITLYQICCLVHERIWTVRPSGENKSPLCALCDCHRLGLPPFHGEIPKHPSSVRWLFNFEFDFSKQEEWFLLQDVVTGKSGVQLCLANDSRPGNLFPTASGSWTLGKTIRRQ